MARRLSIVLAGRVEGPATAILSFGNGSQGALGTLRHEDEYEPETVDLFTRSAPAAVGAGHYHSFAISTDGCLWSWGRNDELQLGRRLKSNLEASTSDSKPGNVEGLQGVKVTSCTGSGVASFATSSEGRLFSWGSSKRGQLGLGNGHVQSVQPLHIRGLQNIVQVAAGWGHTLALDDDGRVWSWGFPQHGRLGHSFASSPAETVRLDIMGLTQEEEASVLRRCVWTPKQIDSLSGHHIKQVACGMDFSLAVDRDGTVFAFGDNSLSQLGKHTGTSWCDARSGDIEGCVVRYADGKPVTASKVAAGLGHCLAVTQQGDLVSWGWNSAGQLGLGLSQKAGTVVTPSAVVGVPIHPRAHVSAGRVHSLLATDDLLSDEAEAPVIDAKDQDSSSTGGVMLTQTYTWGSGLNGRLGLGSQQEAPYPELIAELDGSQVLGAACGFDHTLVLIRL